MMQYYFNNITVIQVINKYLASEDYFVRYQKREWLYYMWDAKY